MKDKSVERDNKVQGLINTSLDKIRNMVDVNCVIGEPVTLPDNSTIIPISKVSVGFVSGGGEYSDLNSKRTDAEMPMAGGTGGGYTVSPIGFFVLKNNHYKMVHADKSSAYLTLLKNATEVLKSMAGNKEK